MSMLRPIAYFDRVQVSEVIDPRDMVDKFFHSQIDYLVQNVSETSAIDIKVFLNGDLLHGPFSLVAGDEASVGICFFDEMGHMLNEYPQKSQFNICITYTNSNKSKKFLQTEVIGINFNSIRLDGKPIYTTDYSKRTGLLTQIIE